MFLYKEKFIPFINGIDKLIKGLYKGFSANNTYRTFLKIIYLLFLY